MSGLKQLRNRIKTVKSTQKITKAMHIVAAAKLAKIKDQAAQLDNFSVILADIINYLRETEEEISEEYNYFLEPNMTLPHLVIVATSERGLCGSFNSAIIKKVKNDLLQYQQEGKKFKLIIVGKKGFDALKDDYRELIEQVYHIVGNNYECVAREIKQQVMNMAKLGKIGACCAYYNKFKNAIIQIPSREQILPVEHYVQQKTQDKNTVKEATENVKADSLLFEFEGENLIENVINLYIQGEINYALLQSKASEEGARMSAMDNSTKNAKELIEKLTLKLNRSRQAIITTELTEIIAGAEAVS